MKTLFSCILLVAISGCLSAQDALPIKTWTGSAGKPLIFYISGDGGLNQFSTDLSVGINRKGFSTIALNARSYFWNKKPAEQASRDIAAAIEREMVAGSHKTFVVVGYSFGADVLPFVVNRFPPALRRKLQSVVLISPSVSTDLQIHLLDMLTSSSRRNMDVVSEINRMGTLKTTIFFGSDEKDFPVSKITLANHDIEILPGGHHFEGNTSDLANYVVKSF